MFTGEKKDKVCNKDLAVSAISQEINEDECLEERQTENNVEKNNIQTDLNNESANTDNIDSTGPNNDNTSDIAAVSVMEKLTLLRNVNDSKKNSHHMRKLSKAGDNLRRGLHTKKRFQCTECSKAFTLRSEQYNEKYLTA